MLSSLHIENIAVIERADIAFDRGLTVLTGETGAGKSIIIDSLNAVLGERIHRDILRTGCEKALVSAVFDSLPDSLVAALREMGAEPDEDGILLLERRLTADGKAAARLNGRPVPVSVLREVGRRLLNIHGQHENQTLLQVDTHMQYLDRLGGLSAGLMEYQAAFREWKALSTELQKLDTDETEKARRMDLLRYQIDEIEAAQIEPGEEEQLREKREQFRHSERIAAELAAAHRYFWGDDDTAGGLSLLEQGVQSVTMAGRYVPSLAALAEHMQSLTYDWDACAADLRAAEESLEFDAAERDRVDNRYELLRHLFSKYGADSHEVLAYCQTCRDELETIESGEERQAQLTLLQNAAEKRVYELAAALSAQRRQTAERFSAAVTEQLRFLDMPQAMLAVQIDTIPPGPTGTDRVEFQFTANPGETPRPLVKIASGGEMSRVMLALQTVLTNVDETETLVFDEIDTGISGRAALKVGEKMRETAGKRRRQVLCVTHLAQIAAQADHHLLIQKAVRDNRTFTEVTPLDESGREQELARIIAGNITPAGVQAAKEMRRQATENSEKGGVSDEFQN